MKWLGNIVLLIVPFRGELGHAARPILVLGWRGPSSQLGQLGSRRVKRGLLSSSWLLAMFMLSWWAPEAVAAEDAAEPPQESSAAGIRFELGGATASLHPSAVMSHGDKAALISEGELTLEQFIALALRWSQLSLRAQGEYKITQHNVLRAGSVYAPVWSSGLEFTNMHAERLPRPERDAFQSFGLSSRLTQNIAPGSTVSLTLKNHIDELPLRTPPHNVEPRITTSAELGLAQSLTQNQFGWVWQLQQEMAQLGVTMGRHELAGQLDQLTTTIVGTFFRLKTEQLRHESLVARMKKNQEIFDTAQMLRRRGQVEAADVLNIEARYLLAVAAKQQAWVELQNSWDLAADAIGLPPGLVGAADLANLDLSYGALLPAYSPAGCAELVSSAQDFRHHSGYQLRQGRLKMARMQQRLLEDKLKPDLQLKFAYAVAHVSEQQDVGSGEAMAHPRSGDHGAFKVGLELNLRLGGAQAQADLWDSAIRVGQARLEAQTFSDRLRVELGNSCRLVEYLVKRQAQLKEIYQKQQRRARLQRQRFNIGRQDFFTATAGELEAIRAKFDYEVQIFGIEHELRKQLILRGKMVTLTESS